MKLKKSIISETKTHHNLRFGKSKKKLNDDVSNY
jgi:hypothetical protein